MSVELRGTDLRHWIIGEARKQSPISIRMMIASAADQGFSFAGRPSKVISDALRCERRRGRIVKTGRGEYTLGTIPRTSGRLIDQRLSQLAAAAARSGRQERPAA